MGIKECEDLERNYTLCLEPIALRKSGYGPFHLKSQAPAKFNEEKVAPSLDVNFSPSILATSYDH